MPEATAAGVEHWLAIGNVIMELEYEEELILYAINPLNPISHFIMEDHFSGVTAEDLKTRFLVNIVAEHIAYMYKREQSAQGPKPEIG